MGRERIIAVRFNTLAITKGFLGSTAIMHTAACFDDFTTRDGDLADGVRWIDYGPSLDYKAVVELGKCRLGLPDGLTEPVERISYARYHAATSPCEDGYLECRVFSVGTAENAQDGNSRFKTVVYAKVSNDSFEDGVGLSLAGSHITLIVRTAGVDAGVASFGTYTSGDIIRLRFTGKNYTVEVNGRSRGTWADSTGRVQTGEDHRSLGLRVHGAHEQSDAGPRKFSPTLDYVEYGC